MSAGQLDEVVDKTAGPDRDQWFTVQDVEKTGARQTIRVPLQLPDPTTQICSQPIRLGGAPEHAAQGLDMRIDVLDRLGLQNKHRDLELL